ncbi:hypothetical protein B0H17DRAFT_1135451 [Mycena rosella]|uniref:Uncharacterized protein n=1 Tax=Mycena rosella TaxID=1033263 RepID=A0AAD7DDE7_MYCRO|nr:hypothetical protein B0H17DRAFT_1135451 [Mycena rosella]
MYIGALNIGTTGTYLRVPARFLRIPSECALSCPVELEALRNSDSEVPYARSFEFRMCFILSCPVEARRNSTEGYSTAVGVPASPDINCEARIDISLSFAYLGVSGVDASSGRFGARAPGIGCLSALAIAPGTPRSGRPRPRSRAITVSPVPVPGARSE